MDHLTLEEVWYLLVFEAQRAQDEHEQAGTDDPTPDTGVWGSNPR